MMPVSIGTGLECVGVVGPELGLLLGWAKGSDAFSSANTRNKKRSPGASSMASPMPKSVPLGEKR